MVMDDGNQEMILSGDEQSENIIMQMDDELLRNEDNECVLLDGIFQVSMNGYCIIDML
jgi:hypothetical protein